MRNFVGYYDSWRHTRIKKIVTLFGGEEFFKDKTMLELGCGYGDIGAYFKNIGAIVTLAEGRQEHVDEIKKRHKDIEVIQLDQDAHWNLNRKFDIIIHMGVLYHLKNWRQDLKCTLNHSDLLVLETEVANRSAIDFEMIISENSKNYDQSLHGEAARASAACIEKELQDLGGECRRYDDIDLNAAGHTYDWEVDDNGPTWKPAIFRRFWTVTK